MAVDLRNPNRNASVTKSTVAKTEDKAVTDKKPAAALATEQPLIEREGPNRPSADVQRASRQIAMGNEALRRSLESRVPTEGIVGGVVTAENFQAGVEYANAARAEIASTRDNLAAARAEVTAEIDALSAKATRTPGEELLLDAKRGQSEHLGNIDRELQARDIAWDNVLHRAQDGFLDERDELKTAKEDFHLLGHNLTLQQQSRAVVGKLENAYLALEQEQGAAKPTATKAAAGEPSSAMPTLDRTREQVATTDRVRKEVLEDGVGLAVGNLDKGAAAADLDALAARHAARKEQMTALSTEVGAEISALEGKARRTPGEEQLLSGKRAQKKTADDLVTHIDARLAHVGRVRSAVDDGNLSQAEAKALSEARLATIDKPGVGLVQAASESDAKLLEAYQTLSQEPTSPGVDASTEELCAAATGATATTRAAGAPSETVEVERGDSLSKIASRYQNGDGSPVTWEQLVDVPENEKFRANPNLIMPGQQVAIPHGAKPVGAAAVEPDAPAASTSAPRDAKPDAKADAKPAAGKVVKGLSAAPIDGNAPLTDKQLGTAVTAIALGVGPNKGEMRNANTVLNAVKDLSPGQLAQVMEAYDQKFAAQGFSFDQHVKGSMFPWNQQALEALDKGDRAGFDKLRAEGRKLDAQVDADTKTLRNAIEGMGTKEQAIFDTLQKHVDNPAMMRAVAQWYKTQHGEDLKSRVISELQSGDFGELRNVKDDVARATALFRIGS